MINEKNSTKHALSLMRAGLTRRQLLRVLGISAAGVATTGLLAACADTDDDDTAADDDTEDAAAEPDDDSSDDSEDVVELDDTDDEAEEVEETDEVDEEDETESDVAGDRPSLIVGIHNMPGTMDPNSNDSLVGFLTQYNTYEFLFRRNWLDSDPPGFGTGIEPGLAESWEFVDDNTLEVTVRDDVTWHNGDPFTAEDVVFTIERILNYEEYDVAEIASASAHLSTISSVEQLDDYSLRITTADPDPLLEMRMAVWASWIIPKNYYEEVGLEEFRFNPVGTGPYRVLEFVPDDRIVMEAFDDYWMETPVVSAVELRVIPETSTRVAALVSGEVDIITNISPDQRETLDETDGVHSESIESLNMHTVEFNCHHPHVADPRIRQALCYAIDRQLLVDALWHGEARVPAGHQFIDFPDHLIFDQFELPYDPDRAAELMEEAGYDDELITFLVHPSYYAGYADAAQAIIEMWIDAGFNAEMILTEDSWQDLGDDLMARNRSNSSHMGDPAGSQLVNWGPGTTAQENFWDAPDEYNELGAEQERTRDEDRRAEIWERMNEIFMEERPGTPLYNWIEIYGVRDGLDFQPYGVPYMDFRGYNLTVNQDD